MTTAVEDFIAQDPSSRDFVNVHSNVRWGEIDVRNRTEAILESMFTVSDQRILARKVDGYTLGKVLAISPDPLLPLPAYDLTPAEKSQLLSFSVASLRCGELKDVMWARAQVLTGALDYEAARDGLNSLPAVDPLLPDPFADIRVAYQSIMDAASQAVKDLVADRDVFFGRVPPA